MKGEIMDFPTDADELIELVGSGTLSGDQLLELVRQHSHFASGCEICIEILENEPAGAGCFFDYVFETNKVKLTTEVVEYLIANVASTVDYDWASISKWDYALHPKSSQVALKGSAYDWGYYMFKGVGEGDSYTVDEVLETLERVAAHPLATEAIIREWLGHLHDPGEMGADPILEGCEGDIDACPTCQGIFDRVWGD